ncbi:MAG TPA: hypothetical protein VNT99_10090 [Methylomirabilota bacterium]|nr:hypothetical protein [Methylomirabilota bacterium]
MSTAIFVVELLILGGVVALGFILKNYLPSYFAEKGRNLATKEDIEEITRRIEEVKLEIDASKAVQQAKRNLKHEACLEALCLVDAHLSHKFIAPEGGKLVKQYATTEAARKCHSKLILACDNTEIIDRFSDLMFGSKEKMEKPLTDLLNAFRNLIRKELGFGQELSLDRERAWFGALICENKLPNSVEPIAVPHPAK